MCLGSDKRLQAEAVGDFFGGEGIFFFLSGNLQKFSFEHVGALPAQRR